MTQKKFSGAPFGVQTARFNVSSIHPKSKTPGSFTQIGYDKRSMEDYRCKLGPGSYNIDVGGFSTKAVHERAIGPGWERAYETSKMAKIPHLLYKEQWKNKQLQKRLLGPGTYNIKDFIETGLEKPRSTRGFCETRDARFQDIANNGVPGPGTYGKGGIPSAVIEDKQTISASNVGMMDSGKNDTRQLPEVGSHLCPGQYEMASFTDELATRVVSKRGPYDLFTGERNKPVTVGYFATPVKQKLGPGEYDLRSFLDENAGEHKMRHGRFLKVERFQDFPKERIYCCTLSQCPRDPDDPGPGAYSPAKLSKPEPSKRPPFGSSAERMNKHARRYFLGNYNPVGPGRYTVRTYDEAQHINGHQSAFDSRTKRSDLLRDKYMKERIRAKDVRPEDKVFMVPLTA